MNDTAALVQTLSDYLARYVVLTEDQRLAVALWAMHTHVYLCFSTTPYLVVTSAEPRSGKTRLIECLSAVVRNPDPLVSPTEAVLFRGMGDEPTMLIDETDTIFGTSKYGPSEKQEGLRAIINAGYRKGGIVKRCIGTSNVLERFDVFGPKLLAGIGHLPVTIEDRGLCVRLERRMPDEIIERFRYETGTEWGERLRPQIEGWASGARLLLLGARPELPEALDDRAQDAYEVLIAIADLAGGTWGERARVALVALREVDGAVKESTGVKLFRDIGAFVEQLAKMEKIATMDLLAWLYEQGDEPWEEWWGESSGKRAAKRLAMVLAEYAVHPTERWRSEDGGRLRGYLVAEILGARERYIGEDMGTWAKPFGDAGLSDLEHGPENGGVAHVENGDLQGKAHVPMLQEGGDTPDPLWGDSEGWESGK